MNFNKKPPIKTLWWKNNTLFLIDQRVLPGEETTLTIKDVKTVWNAIKNLTVRGAPAIGCTAAYGMALAALNSENHDRQAFLKDIKFAADYLKTSRPTAYNLFYAVDRMENAVKRSSLPVEQLVRLAVEEAEKIYTEDLQCCYQIGENGCELLRNNMNALTHCNAGGLATSGFGTALSVFFSAKDKGKKFHVYVDETRPVLQGARLTAWELGKAGIPYTLICDNMAGWLMSQKKVDIVITGADRIAKNGDTANKIGTYSLAVLCEKHGVDFYIAAPYSTFDFSIETGRDIPIEERTPGEIREIGGKKISPENAPVYNPAFDVTPAELIKGFITEKGIFPPVHISSPVHTQSEMPDVGKQSR
jgi:methylthioribose-1-phosphate isomerase